MTPKEYWQVAVLKGLLASAPPRPWKSLQEEGDPWWIVDATGAVMGDVNGDLPLVGPFIATAVNGLPDLLTILERQAKEIERLQRALLSLRLGRRAVCPGCAAKGLRP